MGNLPLSDKKKPISRSNNQTKRSFTLTSGNILNDSENDANDEYMDDEKLTELLNHCRKSLSENYDDNEKIPILFQWPYGGKSVFVSGSFNNWKEKIKLQQISTEYFRRMKFSNIPSRMTPKANTYYGIINLPVGVYTYKYIVDEKWVHDKQKPVVINGFGTPENIIEVKRSDFNVLEALRNDENVATKRIKPNDENFPAWKKYSREIPDYENDINFSQSLPPDIPPYLEEKIFIDSNIEFEDSKLLPTKHVIFNHILTHSVKNNVVMTSLVTSFRDKVVTTIYYKPLD